MLKVYQSLLDAPLALTTEAKTIIYPILAKLLSGEMGYDNAQEPHSDPSKIEGSIYVTEEGQEYYYGSENFNVDGVGVYLVEGVINSRNSYWDVSSTRALKRVSWENENNPNVLAHVFHVKSGGGDATELEQTTTFLNDNLKKPTLTIFTGQGGSAAYGLFCGSKKVYSSSKMDRIGSIGVVVTLRDDTEMRKRMGINLIEIKAEQSTKKNIEAIDAINGDTKPYQDAFVTPVGETFINLIKKYRPATIGHESIFEGQTFLAQDAVNNGLLDGIKSYEDVIAEAFVLGKAYKQNAVKPYVSSNNQNSMKVNLFGLDISISKSANGEATISAEQWAQVEAKEKEVTQAATQTEIEKAIDAKLQGIESKYAGENEALKAEIATLKAWQTNNPATVAASISNPPAAEETKPLKPWEEFNKTTAQEYITAGLAV